MDWFLYDVDLSHERLKYQNFKKIVISRSKVFYNPVKYLQFLPKLKFSYRQDNFLPNYVDCCVPLSFSRTLTMDVFLGTL